MVPTEAELIASAHHGDGAAWEALVLAYQEPVFRLAYLFLGDADDAQDIAQETFIRAYHHLGQFNPTLPLKPWLLAIAANQARNRMRSFSRYLAAIQRLAQGGLKPADSTADYHPAEQQQEARELWMAVRKLKPEDQQVIYLRYYLEFSEAETAQSLNIPPGTVKSRLHRALERLRREMQAEIPGLEKDPSDGD